MAKKTDFKKRRKTPAGAVKLSNRENALFIKTLKTAVVEKSVEGIYSAALRLCLPDAEIVARFGTDGELKSREHNLVALFEFKFNHDLKDRKTLAKILVQTVYYMKKWEKLGLQMPKVILVGDENECFVMLSNVLDQYLRMEGVDWNVAPSQAYLFNREMLNKIVDDEEIKPFVFNVESGDFDFSTVVDKMLDLNKHGPVRLVRITESNIANIFHYFKDNVLKEEMDTNKQVKLFVNILTAEKEHYLQPKVKNVLVTPDGKVKVDSGAFKSFFAHFDSNYSPTEKAKLIQNCDRLLENEKRRRDGAFFTPQMWVEEADKMISKHLDAEWKHNYVVWDCAAGTGNLTADFKFKDLYVSTLNAEEIDIQEQGGINEDATKFQYDFLSEEGIDGVPEKLKKAFESGKKVLFFINPPYGTANNLEAIKKGGSKEGMALTEVNKIMLQENIGASAQQLYSQFLYKIMKLKMKYDNKVVICVFSPPLFLTGESFEGFRKAFLPNFDFKYGMIFQASEFADVASNWGISFSIWN